MYKSGWIEPASSVAFLSFEWATSSKAGKNDLMKEAAKVAALRDLNEVVGAFGRDEGTGRVICNSRFWIQAPFSLPALVDWSWNACLPEDVMRHMLDRKMNLGNLGGLGHSSS